MRISVFAAAAAVSTAVMAASAIAAPLTVEETFRQFNGVTQGNFNSSQDVEGRLYVGGNLTGSTIQVGVNNGVAPSDYDELIVGGNAAIGTIHMMNGGDLSVGGNVVGGVELHGGSYGTRSAYIGGTQSGGPFNMGTKYENQAVNPDFASRFPEIDFAQYTSESTYLSSLTGTAVDVSDRNNIQITGSGTANALTVVNIDLSDLGNAGGINLDSMSSDLLLINVSGETGNFNSNFLGNSADSAQNVIWNFFEATTINVNSRIIGSILAPFAEMNGFSGSTEGSVIARSIGLTNGELHSRPFVGGVPTVPQVPLPAGLPLLAGALAAFGGMRLLRRAA